MDGLLNFLRCKAGLYLPLFISRHAVAFAKKHFKDKSIIAVELGTDRAIYAKSILTNLNISKLYLIDPYIEYKEYLESENQKTQNELTKCEKIAKRRLRKYNEKIIWVKTYSDKAISFISDNLDFVYIDGNHKYKYVKSDMENYYKKLKKGGILAGHDIVIFPGVMKAFCEFIIEHKIKYFRITKTDWYLIK